MELRRTRLFGRDGEHTPPPTPATPRTIGQGDLIGLIVDNDARAWRGIPFAASTAGTNRWRVLPISLNGIALALVGILRGFDRSGR